MGVFNVLLREHLFYSDYNGDIDTKSCSFWGLSPIFSIRLAAAWFHSRATRHLKEKLQQGDIFRHYLQVPPPSMLASGVFYLDRLWSTSSTMLRRQSSELEEEVQLFTDSRDRKKWDKLSEFFAIIVTTEHLENARISSAVGRDEYTRECSALISQYKDAESALLADGSIASTTEFFKEYQLDCPYAMERLVKYGVPATVLHRNVDERDQIGRARQAAETTQCFITAMDALKLEQRAVDEVQPLISDLMDRLNKVDGLPNDFEGVSKAREWLIQFNSMRASDELSEEQARQLLHDLDTSYSAFFRYLEMTSNKS